MFRKPPHVKSQSPLRSSDRRKLRADLQASFPHVGSRAADLIPVKESKDAGGEVATAKFVAHGGEQGILYLVDGQPLFWRDLDSRLWPTVYALWKVPDMVSTLITHGPVMQKLFDGADLMLPGVITPQGGFPDFKYGEIMGVIVRGNPFPLAIGSAMVSKDNLQSSEMRGKGIRVAHTYGDTLWALGDKSDPPAEADYAEIAESDASGSWIEVETDPSGAATPAESIVEDSQELLQNVLATQEAEPTLTPAEMDELLETSLLTALKTRVYEDPKSLPMVSSLLFSNYITPCRPRGTALDVRHSSYKKVGKFLKAMEKRGWLKLKDRNGELTLVSVNFSHPQIVGFVPPKKVAGDEKPKAEHTDNSTGPSASNKGEKKGDVVSVTDLYRAKEKQLRLVQEMGGGKDSLFRNCDLHELVNGYAKRESLANPQNPRLVKIDSILCDAVLSKDEYNSVDFLPRDEIIKRLAERMDYYHEMKIPGQQEEILRGKVKPMEVVVEQRQGRKTVTRISGMERYGIDAEELAAMLRVKCASSTSVTPLPGGKSASSAKLCEVMVQGSKIKELSALLEKEAGIPFSGGKSRFVNIVQKTKGKK
ncbi:hypothetical protein BC832DRAFT_535091 [Gaertneriomyces semiglobifer]|nr:hypothetical protein BC832DRAFT_535091 [Gaertneriomyces semiglobifer]